MSFWQLQMYFFTAYGGTLEIIEVRHTHNFSLTTPFEVAAICVFRLAYFGDRPCAPDKQIFKTDLLPLFLGQIQNRLFNQINLINLDKFSR
jgi:hypothetical protein